MRKLRLSAAAAAIAALLVLVVAPACLSQGQWAAGGVIVTNEHAWAIGLRKALAGVGGEVAMTVRIPGPIIDDALAELGV